MRQTLNTLFAIEAATFLGIEKGSSPARKEEYKAVSTLLDATDFSLAFLQFIADRIEDKYKTPPLVEFNFNTTAEFWEATYGRPTRLLAPEIGAIVIWRNGDIYKSSVVFANLSPSDIMVVSGDRLLFRHEISFSVSARRAFSTFGPSGAADGWELIGYVWPFPTQPL